MSPGALGAHFRARKLFMAKEHHTISEIVSTVYCERKAVYDRRHGDARPLHVRAKAARGTIDHLGFELESRAAMAIDRRCFIASQVYGGDAPQTVFLRAWRDEVLLQCRGGRALVSFYYATSPFVVRAADRFPALALLIRRALDRVVRLLGWSEH